LRSELDDIYQEIILDHNRKPRNFRVLEGANHRAAGVNPLCGDEVIVFMDIADGVVRDVSFQGRGCAISKASASLMTGSLKGKTVAEARELFRKFHALVTSDADGDAAGDAHGDAAGADGPDLGKLAALGGVRRFPARVKCASLAWHTMQAALEQKDEPVTTE
jgi:nitrogen fixation protein NifU and related proteins